MDDRASRWALVASIAIHLGVVGGPSIARMLGRQSAAPRSDFWAGSTFEPPQEGDEQGASTDKITSEINVEEVNVSTDTESAPATPLSPASPPAPVNATAAADGSPSRSPAARRPKNSAARPRSAVGSGATSAEAGRPAGGSGPFGAEGGAPGVRDLVRSFVRVLPIVASADPVWSTLPLGVAGGADVTLTLDDEGRASVAPFASSVPTYLRRLVNKGLSVMSSGRFAVGAQSAGASQRIHIGITLAQLNPPAADQMSSGGAFGLRFEPPDEHHVSRAFFTLASGRRVEVTVRPQGGHDHP